MILNKLLKQNIDDDISDMSEEDLLLKKEKIIKSVNRKKKIKKVLYILFLSIGLIGGYKALLSSDQEKVYDELEDQAFISAYMQQYYTYPSTDETKEFLKKYTYSTLLDESIEYGSEIEYARISSSNIYKVTVDDKENGIYTYYVKNNYTVKLKDADATSSALYNKVTLAKNEESFLVIKPVSNVTYNIPAIDDEETLKKYKYESESGDKQLEDNEKKDIENTISLFLKTYNEDINQAKLLVSHPETLEMLDSNTQFELNSLNNVTADETTYYIDCIIDQKYKDYISVRRNYHIEIDIEKNKINTMEVY